MKIRAGFVSNSSSSSFVCEICGRSESGFDASHKEFDFVRCPNGHLICSEEAYEFDEPEECDEECDECEREYCSEDEDIPENACPICLFEVSSKSDIKRYLFKRYGIPEEDVFAEVKKKNGRRKKLYDSEYVNYVYEKENITESKLLDELKTVFGTYSKFRKHLRGEDEE